MKFCYDSPLEGTGIRTVSPAVNGTATGERSDGAQPIHHHVDFVGTPQIRSRERDRQFESASLQQRVHCEPDGDDVARRSATPPPGPASNLSRLRSPTGA